MPLKYELTQKAFYPPAPNTERGRGTFLNQHPKDPILAYGSRSNVILHNMEEPLKSKVYTRHTAPVTVAKFAPKGGYQVASADKEGHVHYWGAEKKLIKMQWRELVKGVSDLDITDDNKRIVMCGDGLSGYGAAFLIDTGSSLGNLSHHREEAVSIALKPQRPYRCVTTSTDSTAAFFQGPPYKYIKGVGDHTKFVNCVRYAPDGSQFCTVSTDKTIQFFEGKTGDALGKLEGGDVHKSSMYCVAWSPDSKQILTASADKTVKMWDVESKKLVQTFTFPDKTVDYQQLGVFWSKTHGPMSVSFNGDINYLNVEKPDQPRIYSGHNKAVTKVISLKDTIYTCGMDGVRVWKDGNVGRYTGKGHNKDSVSSMVIAGDKLVTAGTDKKILFNGLDDLKYSQDDAVTLKKSAVSLSASADGKVIVAATGQGIAVIEEGELVLESAIDEANVVAVSPDGKLIAVGSRRVVEIYAYADEEIKKVETIKEHEQQVTALMFSQDGKMLASADQSKWIYVWNTNDWSSMYKNLCFHLGAVTSLAFNSKGMLASGGSSADVIVWDLEGKSKKIQNDAHNLKVGGVCWVSDDVLASVGAMDSTLKTWTV